jgi:prepilin-type N-terminal cleavage/methylation domain-containing protein
MISLHKQPYNPSEQGFSLVETLVAITILLLVIVGPLTISSQSARSTSFASEQVIAFFLAQEGLEIIQKGRDDLVINGFDNASFDAWAAFTNTSGFYRHCYDVNSGCGVELLANASGALDAPIDCGSDARCPLYFDDSIGSTLRSRYTPDQPGTYLSTPYSRTVTMQSVSSDEVRVESTVYWRNSDQREEQSVTVETYLFNIYDD